MVNEQLGLVGVLFEDTHIDKLVLFGSVKLHAVADYKSPAVFYQNLDPLKSPVSSPPLSRTRNQPRFCVHCLRSRTTPHRLPRRDRAPVCLRSLSKGRLTICNVLKVIIISL